MTYWLTNQPRYINKNTIYQFDRFLEYWYVNLTDKVLESKFRRKRSEESLRKFLSLIVKHPSNDPVEERVVYVNKVRNILDNRPLESTMSRIWSEVKESAKK